MNQAAKAASDYANEIANYLRTLPPLRFADIKLTGTIKPPNPMYEVVTPAGRRVADPVQLFKLLEGPPRRTFGRGQLRVV